MKFQILTSHGKDSFHIKPITPGHPIPKISACLPIFWGGTWKTEFVKTIQTREDIIRKEIRRTAQEMLNRVVDNFTVQVAAVLSYSSTVQGANIVVYTKRILWTSSICGEKILKISLCLKKLLLKKNRDIFVGHPVIQWTGVDCDSKIYFGRPEMLPLSLLNTCSSERMFCILDP